MLPFVSFFCVQRFSRTLISIANFFPCRGYQLWNAALGGQTPCYSSLSSYLVPPAIDIPNASPMTVPNISATTSSATNQKPTSAVVNILLAVQFDVEPASPSTSTSRAAGARVGVGGGLAIIGLLNFLL
jgi:hypothetical protein